VTREQQNDYFLKWASEHNLLLRKVARSFAFGADQEDLYNEMLVAVWQAIPAWRGDAKPSTFVYRVAHNYALTWTRTRRNYSRAVERFGREAASPTGSTYPDALLNQLYAAIRELPELDRSLVLLSFDGLPYKEIGEILGLSESNVGARLTRARARLTETLREQDQ